MYNHSVMLGSQESHATLHWLDLTALVHIPQGNLTGPGFDSTSPERAITCAAMFVRRSCITTPGLSVWVG